ncbi:MAG: molybdopterin molybdotransferase MoeA [Proteobacteria bacterium]|nr:molybdopterin molybdotransferase MoeA [Pseudomonadota bacterium]
MKRLVNDCFANTEDMISASEALLRLEEAVQPITETEFCSLMESENRILAEDIVATTTVPPKDNSAVDGYAFCHAEYAQAPHQPRINLGRSAAGHPFVGEVKSNGVVKILTGAVMPNGMDSVAMIEDVSLDGDLVILPSGLKAGANCRKAGEDISPGQRLLEKGTLLRPQEIGYLSSIGTVALPVRTRLRVGLFSTGDELVNPGDPQREGSIHDSNRFILGGILRSFGCEVTDLGILKDSPGEIETALQQAAMDHDVIITSGGVSMGDEDHVKTALSAAGNLHFWKIAIKPGRPLALGQIGESAFVGLPGNPVAALVCALIFVRPLIAKMSGLKTQSLLSFKVPAAFSFIKKPGRTEWLRGRYDPKADGSGTVEKFHTEGSGILTSTIWANGLIELGDDVAKIEEGDPVTFLPFSELMR